MRRTIVVGGGIAGASTAYHLAKAGVGVTLVDRSDSGQATDAAAGIICPWLSQRRNKTWYQLAKNGARYYPVLIKELEAMGERDTGYKQVGGMCLHTSGNKLDQIEERAYERREEAPEIGEIKRLSTAETKKLFPPIADGYGAIFVSGAARVSGRSLRNALVRAAEKLGATVLHGDAALVYSEQRVAGVRVEGKILEADHILVTAGAWANELLHPLGIDINITYQKAQIVHLHLPEADTDTWPVVMPPGDHYIVPFPSGRIVVGATHENDTGMDLRITAGGMYEIFDKALTVAPGLKISTVLEARVGIRPFTPDFLPVFGSVEGVRGLFIANGLGASGLTTGPYIGAELAQRVLSMS
ncbi:MAG: FAD-binding oxidoreductase [Candidatus Carbobacillus altaicus]|nr:FAD-binding oxidoreductase [Candidatus Carbobacillus altaicus]